MLLVRSKESKNSNKPFLSKSNVAGLSATFLGLTSTFSQAQSETASITNTSSIVSVLLSLVVVIAIIFALAFVVRRFNVAQAGQGQLKVVASMMAGHKEKIMVIKVGDEQHLVGVTSHNINHLAKLETGLDLEPAQGDSKLNFQAKLVQAMAQSMGAKANKTGASHE